MQEHLILAGVGFIVVSLVTLYTVSFFSAFSLQCPVKRKNNDESN